MSTYLLARCFAPTAPERLAIAATWRTAGADPRLAPLVVMRCAPWLAGCGSRVAMSRLDGVFGKALRYTAISPLN